MKKILLLLIIVLLCGGCNKTENINKKQQQKNNIEKNEVESNYIDNNRMPIGFYNNKKRITEYKTNIVSGTDIGIFQIYPSKEEVIYYDSYADSFYSEWLVYDPSHKVKIGYNLSYTLKDGTKISHNILSLEDCWKYEGYIVTFLYDDYFNRNSSWYSHIEPNNFDDNTFITSIKLYPQSGVGDINSKITLTVFTYDTMDDFDEVTKEYRGNSKYSITICDINKSC